MAEPLSVVKLLDVSPTALIKTTSATVKGLLVIGIICLIGWMSWVTLIQPHTKWAVQVQTTQQKADSITNYNGLSAKEVSELIDSKFAAHDKLFTWGIKVGWFKIGKW